MFPQQNTWSALSGNYFNLKNLLTEKYGQPSNDVEEFQSYIPKDDASKMRQIQLGACKYYTTYETDKGTIHLSIEHDDLASYFVKLTYSDRINKQTINNL